MVARYLVRLDDACPTMDAGAWGALEEAFDRLGLRPIVGVIPDNRDSSMNCSEPAHDFWERVSRWQHKGWGIALHGLHHVYHEISPSDRSLIPLHGKSEFVGLALGSQKNMLRRSQAMFREHGIAPALFMAPSHTFDANTLEALAAETDIRIVTDGQALFPYVDQGFLWIPQQLWRFRRMPFGVWTVCLHPNTMSSSQVAAFIAQMEIRAAHRLCRRRVLSLCRQAARQAGQCLRLAFLATSRAEAAAEPMSKVARIRLALIISGLSTGGAEAMLLKLLQKIDRSRFTPTVISLTTTGEIGPHIEAQGIPVHALGMKPGAPSPIKFLRLVRLLLQLKPDVVHTWMYHADLLGGLAARFAGIKAVAWGIRHSNLSPDQNKRSTLQVMKVCAHVSGWLPQRILTCSERAQSIHVTAGYRADKMVLIPNGFDFSRFQPDAGARDAVRAEIGLAPDTPIVGLVARNDPQKNHPGFIETAAHVHAALPQVHFVLAGTGIDRDNKPLTELIEKAGLMDLVHLLGRRDDIPRLMASFDLLASSSFGEAFPNVLGEAMASGVPCVATDVGDSALIVGSTGHIVQPADPHALSEAIRAILALNPVERRAMGKAARQRVELMFDIGVVVKRFENFYQEIVCEGGAA